MAPSQINCIHSDGSYYYSMTLVKRPYHLVKDKLLHTGVIVSLHNYITQQLLDSNIIGICLNMTVIECNEVMGSPTEFLVAPLLPLVLLLHFLFAKSHMIHCALTAINFHVIAWFLDLILFWNASSPSISFVKMVTVQHFIRSVHSMHILLMFDQNMVLPGKAKEFLCLNVP